MIQKFFTAIFSAALLAAANAYAGGLILYEIGTPDVGLASAGWAARADDAGTVFTNPAGMTRFDSPEVLIGAQPIYLNVKFDPNSETTTTGSKGNASEWLPAGGSFLVMPLTENLSVGAASLGYFGSKLDYGHHWVGRYYLTRAECQGFSFVPGAAYRLTKCLSVGACVNVMYAIDRIHAMVNNTLDGLHDGRIRAIGNHWAVGAVVGVLYEHDECTRFGVTYVSEVKQKFNMKPKLLDVGPRLTEALTNLGITNTKVKVLCNVPNWVMVSAYKKISPCIALMGNFGWQQWSKFTDVEFTVGSDSSASITVTPKCLDTWHGAIGLEYYWECSKASVGFAYDSSIVSNKNRTPSLPLGEQWRFGAGYQYSLTDCLKLNAAYEISWSGNLKMHQERGPLAGTLAGKYRNVYASFFDLSITWDF
jgi:long-chain fatty acid transport protein